MKDTAHTNDPIHVMATTVGMVIGFKVLAVALIRSYVRRPSERDALAQTLAGLFDEAERQVAVLEAPFPQDPTEMRVGLQTIRQEIFEELRRPLPPSGRSLYRRLRRWVGRMVRG